jgi:hypothetical protein
MLQCSVCATCDFQSAEWSSEVPLCCPTCHAVFCLRCAARFRDHSGVKMLCCPKCSCSGIERYESKAVSPLAHEIREAVMTALPGSDVRNHTSRQIR